MRRNWTTIDAFTEVGKTGKTRGKDGALRATIMEGCLEDILVHGFVFIDIDGSIVPYAIEDVRDIQGIVLELAGIENAGEAGHLVGRTLLLPSYAVQPKSEAQSELRFAHLLGYRIIDAEHGVLGEIRKVESFPEQEIAIITHGDREVMIPLNDTFIDQIDEVEQIVTVDLPEGLLDL